MRNRFGSNGVGSDGAGSDGRASYGVGSYRRASYRRGREIQKNNPSSIASLLGLIAVTLAGSIWTGLAVAEGSGAVMLFRFAASIVGGLYYLTLYRLATGRRFFQSSEEPAL